MTIDVFENELDPTIIHKLSGNYSDNEIFIKRDDQVPFSFGGNKARKAREFYKDIKSQNPDVIITYGSNSSNHCRIICNMAASLGLKAHIISADADDSDSESQHYNNWLVKSFGAKIDRCSVQDVSSTIDRVIDQYKCDGLKPYFIMGGGHGNIGTLAYYKVFAEILEQEKKTGQEFDYIFHASGTGTTQAGLVCGKIERMVCGEEKNLPQIVGISIARKSPYGRDVVIESIRDFLKEKGNYGLSEEKFDSLIQENTIFTDKYRLDGYGEYNSEIRQVIEKVLKTEGIPMDTTYVGKAFWGMLQYLKDNGISDKKVLFIHTGGTPLFFDMIKR